MRKHQILTIGISLLVGYLLATSLNRTSSGQPPAPQPAAQEVAVWRYQATVPIQGAFGGVIILTDTATGRCWTHGNFQGADWVDLRSPADRK
jgi:hypothetical protein